jgi:hypothetical protein
VTKALAARSGLPDVTFIFKPKSQFGKILEGLVMEDVGIVCSHLVYLWPFGILCGHLVYFVAIRYIWYVVPRKIGKPASRI